MSSSRVPGLAPFFEPKSIAVVGASNVEGKIGFEVIRNLKDIGYPGRIYPVNPRANRIFDIECFPNLRSINSRIDLCIVLVRAAQIRQVLEEGIKVGITHYIVESAGFKEIGPEGELLEADLSKLVRDERIRIVGPNCLGVYDNVSKLDTFFIPRRLVQRPKLGTLSLASQSGSFVGHFLDLSSSENLGVARAITYGNRVDVEESDTLRYFADDAETKIVGLYIEGIKEGREFVKAARLCSSRKPVVVLKTGKYEETSEAVASHTGALAGSYASYRAAFKKAGTIEVESLEEFVDTCRALSKLPRAKGKRVIILGHAGGLGLTLADHCISRGLEVPQTSGKLTRSFKDKTVPFASLRNPIDLTASGTDEQAREVLDTAFVNSDFADVAMYLALWGLPQSGDKIGKIVSEVISKSGKPVVVASLTGKVCQEKRHIFEDLGVPVFMSLERAALVAAHLAQDQTQP